jgi:hypothetical protein
MKGVLLSNVGRVMCIEEMKEHMSNATKVTNNKAISYRWVPVMRKTFRLRVTFFLIFLASIDSLSQEVSTGLKFATPEQLLGVPLASTPFSGEDLPHSFDLADKMPPAGNQGHQSSCVAWSVAYACKSYQEKLEENNSYWNGAELNSDAVFSPAFVYNQINNGVDGGCQFFDALNVLSTQGVVKWRVMPYNETDYITRPSQQQRESGKRYRIDFWRKVNVFDPKEVKAQIRAGYPVMIGTMVDRGFVDGGFASNGQDYFWKNINGQQLGGHAMIVVGYDDDRGGFKVLNSWGRNWGKEGYCWILYSFFPQVVREGYVMKDAVNSPEDSPRPNPTPDPKAYLNANLKVINVQHNLIDPPLGTVMRFDGSVDLPQGIGNTIQVVVRFFTNNGNNGKGTPVGSFSPFFMMPDGTAACGTPKLPIQAGNGIPWFAIMPYQFLNVPRGTFIWSVYNPATTYLIAEATLYIDDFAVQVGQPIPFFVKL